MTRTALGTGSCAVRCPIGRDFLVVGSGIAGLTCALRCAAAGSVAPGHQGPPARELEPVRPGRHRVGLEPRRHASSRTSTTRSIAGAGPLPPRRRRDGRPRGAGARPRPDRARRRTSTAASDPEDRDYDLGQEGGHSQRRILHALDATGHEIIRALTEAVRADARRSTILENHLAVDLLLDRTSDPRRLLGRLRARPRAPARCTACSPARRSSAPAARARCTSTRRTPTSRPATASRWRIAPGAPIANMEFFQFHPTCLYHPQAKSFLLTEALRGEGAVLRRPDGERVHAALRPARRARAARHRRPRDRQRDEGARLRVACTSTSATATPTGSARASRPSTSAACASASTSTQRPDPRRAGRALLLRRRRHRPRRRAPSLPRLYACGEVACTGLHGANRLASNSLLEALVFAHRAAAHALRRLARATAPRRPTIRAVGPRRAPPTATKSVVVTQNWDEIRRFMWNYVGIVRSDRRLARARERIALLQEEIRAVLLALPAHQRPGRAAQHRHRRRAASSPARSSRRESRGLHYTIDHPEPDPRLGRATRSCAGRTARRAAADAVGVPAATRRRLAPLSGAGRSRASNRCSCRTPRCSSSSGTG